MTLVEGNRIIRGKLTAKAEALIDVRRAKLTALTKEQLADKIVISPVNRQLNAAWNYAVVEARMARALYDDDGQQLFMSVNQMKAALPEEVLEKLYEAMAELLSEREDAQVFPEPHTSKG